MKEKYFATFQELDSDDELPDSYSDLSIPPAYLDDYRFDKIQFPWVSAVNVSREDSRSETYVYESQCKDVIFRRKGVLKGQDLYCLKSLEALSCNNTLLWFVNFLLYKDLQSPYNYLQSCLVSDSFPTVLFTNKKYSQKEPIGDKGRYEILIKT